MNVLGTMVIIGNCQAQFLERLFTAAGAPLQVERLQPNYMMGAADHDAVERKMDAAAVIFAQRTDDGFGQVWQRSTVIAARYPGKVWVWPNIYFDGYFPQTRYVYLPGTGKLQSPLEDYHLTPVFEAFKAGQSEAAAVRRLREDACGVPDPFAASLQNLRDRERGCTVVMSDYVAEAVGQSRCFYTPNHPHTFLLVELGRRLAAAAGLAVDLAKMQRVAGRLDKIDMPVFDWVMRRYGLGFDNHDVYKGVAVKAIDTGTVRLGDVMFYDSVALTRKFFEIYRAAL